MSAPADFNKDGHLDIVTTGHNRNEVGLLLGDGKGGFRRAPASPFPAGRNSWALTIDDIDRDGNLDIVTIPYERVLEEVNQLVATILFGDGKGGFRIMPGSPLSLAGCRGPNRVAVGDFVGNGLREIVVSCAQNGKIFFFLAKTDGSFGTSNRPVPTGWGGLAAGRLKRGDSDDLVVANHSAGTITIMFTK